MYGKLFVQMYHGTLAASGWQALVTFQQLIILANKDGEVDMTADALSRLTTIPLEVITTGLAALEAPDAGSRSPAEEGRRIVRLSDGRAWGWRIVNYAHYRAIRSEEERREYQRQYMAVKRAAEREEKSANTEPNNANCKPELAMLAQVVSSKQEAVSIKAFAGDLSGEGHPETHTNGPPWSTQAIGIYQEFVPHPIPPGRITKVLKPFVVRDGPEVVLRKWREFCKTGRHFGMEGRTWTDPPLAVTKQNPERFRDTYDRWDTPLEAPP